MQQITRRNFAAAAAAAIGSAVFAGTALAGTSEFGELGIELPDGWSSAEDGGKLVIKDAEGATRYTVAKAAEMTPTDGEGLEVVESAWWYVNGYVYWGAVMVNHDQERWCGFPKFRVTAKAADGSIVATNDQTCMEIAPGGTIAFATMLGSSDSEPATVDISAVPAGDRDWRNRGAAPDAFATYGVTEVDGGIFPKFTGMVQNFSDEEEMVAVTVLLRDEEGNIVDGTNGFANHVPAGGEAPFEVTFITTEVAPHASFEVFVQPW